MSYNFKRDIVVFDLLVTFYQMSVLSSSVFFYILNKWYAIL